MTQNTPPVCDYTNSDYQTSFWEHADRAYEDGAEVVALRRLLPASGSLLLELGAGAGRNTPRYTGYERIVLVDYSHTQLEQARARLGDNPRYTYVAADVYKLPFVDGFFDGATMIRTLHHMADAPLALAQTRRVLAPAGVFILEYASKLNLKAIGRYLLGRHKWNPFTREPVEFVELNFDFHPAAIRAWLRELGFKVERQLTVSHLRFPLFKRLLPLKLLVALDALFSLTGDLWQLTPSVFVRSHVPANTGETTPVTGFFRCPACGSTDLQEKKNGVECRGCRKHYPLENGIYDFRV
jgi:ubiquinone/menaquinone biosynthesis C-methylase UbiE